MNSYIIVSGAPGSGKSTLAEPLAEALGFPLLSKDTIKERLYDSLGKGEGDALSWSKQLGSASMELIWTLAARFPEVVLEANFRPHSAYERSRIAALRGPVVEVHCSCPPQLAKVYTRIAPEPKNIMPFTSFRSCTMPCSGSSTGRSGAGT